MNCLYDVIISLSFYSYLDDRFDMVERSFFIIDMREVLFCSVLVKNIYSGCCCLLIL